MAANTHPLTALGRWARQRQSTGYKEYEALAANWDAMEADPVAWARYNSLRGEEQLIDLICGDFTPGEKHGPLDITGPDYFHQLARYMQTCLGLRTDPEDSSLLGRRGPTRDEPYYRSMVNIVVEAYQRLGVLLTECGRGDLIPDTSLYDRAELVPLLRLVYHRLCQERDRAWSECPAQPFYHPIRITGDPKRDRHPDNLRRKPHYLEHPNELIGQALNLAAEAMDLYGLLREENAVTLGFRIAAFASWVSDAAYSSAINLPPFWKLPGEEERQRLWYVHLRTMQAVEQVALWCLVSLPLTITDEAAARSMLDAKLAAIPHAEDITTTFQPPLF